MSLFAYVLTRIRIFFTRKSAFCTCAFFAYILVCLSNPKPNPNLFLHVHIALKSHGISQHGNEVEFKN